MSYLSFLVLFLVTPIMLLGVVLWRDRANRPLPTRWSASPAWLIAILVLVALLYTTPWDNYLVAHRVWWYDPQLVLGITLGWVPLEEYGFFVLQTILASLWFLFLAPRQSVSPLRSPGSLFVWVGVGLCVVIWSLAVGILLFGYAPGTYLALELVWALPPLACQLAFGADVLCGYRRLVVLALVPMVLYLCVVDALAIGSGTWVINPSLSFAALKAGHLPMEEIVFFLLTNTLIVFGMVLGLANESSTRVAEMAKRLTARATHRRRNAS